MSIHVLSKCDPLQCFGSVVGCIHGASFFNHSVHFVFGWIVLKCCSRSLLSCLQNFAGSGWQDSWLSNHCHLSHVSWESRRCWDCRNKPELYWSYVTWILHFTWPTAWRPGFPPWNGSFSMVSPLVLHCLAPCPRICTLFLYNQFSHPSLCILYIFFFCSETCKSFSLIFLKDLAQSLFLKI